MGPPPPKNAICIRKYLFFTLDWSKAHMDKLIALDPCQKVPNKREKGVGVRLNFFIDVLTLMWVRLNQIENWNKKKINIFASTHLWQKWQLDPSKILLPSEKYNFVPHSIFNGSRELFECLFYKPFNLNVIWPGIAKFVPISKSGDFFETLCFMKKYREKK